MSDQPTTLYPNGSMGTLVNLVRPCYDCKNHPVSLMSGVRCQDCHLTHIDREQGKHWADHVLRRVESDPEFRERLRAALGVKE